MNENSKKDFNQRDDINGDSNSQSNDDIYDDDNGPTAKYGESSNSNENSDENPSSSSGQHVCSFELGFEKLCVTITFFLFSRRIIYDDQ